MYFKILFSYFLLLGLLGFFSYGRAHIVNVSTAFDSLIILSLFLYRPAFTDKKICFLFFVFLFYFISSFVFSVLLSDSHILDFLLAYKAIFYFIILLYFHNKIIGDSLSFYKIYLVLLSLFFLKYFTSILLGLNERPLLFRENNFELMFLALIFYLRCISFKEVKSYEIITILIIFLASGSKSGIPILLLVLASHYMRSLSWKNLISLLLIGTTICTFLISLILSKYGLSGLAGIDRLAFLRVFIIEIQSSSLGEILFGHPRITSLLDSSCQALYFYPGLFSYKGDGSCYSLILHSFILRSLFDHGFIGTIIIFYSSYYLIVKSGYTKRDAYTFLGVMFLNSLSVSGYNSVFFALGMIFFIGFPPARNIEARYSNNV